MRGQRKRPLIPLDDALSAGGFEAAVELRGLVRGTERPDLSGQPSEFSPQAPRQLAPQLSASWGRCSFRGRPLLVLWPRKIADTT